MSEERSTPTTVRVVFDANLAISAVLSGRGAAFACFELLDKGQIELFVTESILQEIEEVMTRLGANPKYKDRVTAEKIQGFMAHLRKWATIEPEPPHVFDLERDRDDEVYIDLAIAVNAVYLTSRDNDLLDLMDPETPTGAEFTTKFPGITIAQPAVLLARVRVIDAEQKQES